MNKKIDIFLVSGFLGAGKTTLLKKLLTSFDDNKIGVIVNEFGEISIDGKLLKRDGVELVEINNGSIFCSCLKGSFIQALITFSKHPMDILFVENSGLADPSSIRNILNNVNSLTKNAYNYKGAICVVDSTNFMDYADVLTPVQNQVISSNFILLNKIDRATEDQLCVLEEKIMEINPNAVIFRTIFSQIDFDVLPKGLANEFVGKTSNTPWNRPDVYTLDIGSNLSKDAIMDFLKEIAQYTYRMKGSLQLMNGRYQADCVGDDVQIDLTESDFKDGSKLVLISKAETDIQEILKKKWKERFQTELNINQTT